MQNNASRNNINDFVYGNKLFRFIILRYLFFSGHIVEIFLSIAKADRTLNPGELYDKYMETIGLKEAHFLRSAFTNNNQGLPTPYLFLNLVCYIF